MGRLIYRGYQTLPANTDIFVWFGFFITSTDEDIGYEYMLKFPATTSDLKMLLKNAEIIYINSIKGYGREEKEDKKFSTLLHLENKEKQFKKLNDINPLIIQLTSEFSEIVEYQLYGGRIHAHKYTQQLQDFYNNAPKFSLENITLDQSLNK
jgi:hypothetical protein